MLLECEKLGEMGVEYVQRPDGGRMRLFRPKNYGRVWRKRLKLGFIGRLDGAG